MLLVRIFKILNRYKVRYVVVGGVAAALYGNPRFTKDLDVLADDPEENLLRLIAAFKAIGFTPRIPVDPEEFADKKTRSRWKKEKGMIAFTFINPKTPLENVDILVEATPAPFVRVYSRKTVFRVGKTRIPVISKKDLILMKKKAGRPQDLQDIAILKTGGAARGK